MPNRWDRRLRRRIYRYIPAWFVNNDFEVFTAVLCFLAGVPLLFTEVVGAQSLEAALPWAVVKAWAFILATAPIGIFLGIYRAEGKPIAEVTFWMRLEALGLRALAYAAYIYAIVVVGYSGPQKALPAIALILIFALTCHTRAATVVLKVEDYLFNIGVHSGRQ